MIRSVLVFALVSGALSGPAAALTQDEARKCAVMARTFDGKTAEIEALKKARVEAAAIAETAGEAWENAEPMREISRAMAAEARGGGVRPWWASMPFCWCRWPMW
ncbi:MAG: hypothetical protein AAFY85_06850, partial [Pseudomonadota bacterium]